MELDGTLRKGFRLGDWIVRPIEGVVLGANESRHLQPKTMDVLVCLAESSGQAMTRDELIARVWGANAVSDEPLTRCIHELRRALDDDRGEPTFIQTIPKRGYRLLKEVHELETADELILEQTEPGENPLRQVTRQLFGLATPIGRQQYLVGQQAANMFTPGSRRYGGPLLPGGLDCRSRDGVHEHDRGAAGLLRQRGNHHHRRRDAGGTDPHQPIDSRRT